MPRTSVLFLLAVLALALALALAVAGPVAEVNPKLHIVKATLSDNGDDDGWADTNETVAMRITVYNGMGVDLTGVVALLSTDDPKIACIPDGRVSIGDLSAGEMRTPYEPFFFTVADTDRANPADDFSVTFRVALSADAFEALPDQQITIDLDLDVTGGSGPTTYFESFENGFGTFTTMHLDENLNPPNSDLGNRDAGVINADGHRCQYSDPDWEGSASYGNGAGEQCFPNPNGAPDAFYFRLATDRAFSGVRSLRWNIFLDDERGYTTPTAQLEALRTIDPVNLGWDRVCSVTRTTPCSTDFDCPVGETCGLASPELTMKHQVSMMDSRSVNAREGRTADRGVVAVQMADPSGAPMSHWIKLYPYVNVYDSQAESNYFGCTFDPTDDGDDEGDFFDPSDPIRSQGPSSTCAPGFTFGYQGDTDEPFDPTNIGRTPDGPGLEGAFGIGTWVEPAFDLNRFRGRRLRVRLQTAGRKLGGAISWEQAFAYNPDPGDDGWLIDDVTLTDTLTSPATVTVDTNVNTDIKGDFDFDDVAATCDCAPGDGTAWDVPGEVVGLMLTSSGSGSSTTTMLSWDPPAELGGTVFEYGVISSPVPNDFVSGAGCIVAGTELQALHATDPAPGTAEYFLIRARNACATGTAGIDSSGAPRPVLECP